MIEAWLSAAFGKIGLGICYDIRCVSLFRIFMRTSATCSQRETNAYMTLSTSFPELAMIAARQGCVAIIYPSGPSSSLLLVFTCLIEC